MTLTAQSLLAELDLTLGQATPSWRSSVLRRIVELFLSGAPSYSRDQIALFDAVLVRLCKNADRTVLTETSEQLAALDNAPAGVLGLLARHPDLVVSGPALQHAKTPEIDVLAAADKDRVGPAVLETIAARAELSEAVTDVLLKRGGPAIRNAVVNHPNARFSDTGFARLLVGIKGDKALARTLSARPDLPKELQLWLTAELNE